MPITPWPRQKRSLPTNVQNKFKGVNRLDPLTIDPAFASDMSNVTSRNFPVLTTRPGYSSLGSFAARILGLYAWKDIQLHAISDGIWYYYNGSTWAATAGTGLNLTANWSFTNFKGGFADINLIGANGVDLVKTWDGVSLTNLLNAPVGLNNIEVYNDRLWGNVGNTLRFSEFRVATNWATTTGAETDPGFITIETPNGEQICAIKSGPRRLVIFKPNSMFNLFGSSAQDFTLMPVAQDIGAMSNQAVTTISGQIYFVHQTGIYKYSGGLTPEREFSLRVQDYVNRINPAASTKVCAGTDGKILYIGLPLDSAVEPSVMLEYNTEFDTWCVWNNYNPRNIARMSRDAYVGGAEGQVRKIGGLTTDNGTAITGYWTSKVYGAGSHSQVLRWKRAWLVADVPVGATLDVYLSKDPTGASGFVLVQSVAATTGLASAKVIIPTTTAAYANFVTIKFVFTGVVTIKEYSYEQESLPIV